MFYCANNCGRLVGRGNPQPGDLLICPTCAAAINADAGRLVYRVDPGQIVGQKMRAEPLLPPYRSIPSGLTPLPLPTRKPRRRGWFW